MFTESLEASIGYSQSLVQIGDYNRAIQVLLQERSYFPDNLDLLTRLGELYNSFGTQEMKIRYYESLRYLKHPEFLASLGEAYGAVKDFPHAVECLKESLKINSNDYRSWLALGKCYESYGDLEQALEAYERADKLSCSDPDTLLQLAGVYGKMGYMEKAKIIYEDILKRNPRNRQAISGLKMCRSLFEDKEYDAEEGILAAISRTEYRESFARALAVSMSLVANADRVLTPEEFNFFRLRLRPFKEILPENLDEILTEPGSIDDLYPHLEGIPPSDRIFLFKLVCELAGIDRHLPPEEEEALEKVKVALEIPEKVIEVILMRTIPVTWQSLCARVMEFRKVPDPSNLETLLYNWERYWDEYRKNDSISLEKMMNLLHQVYAILEINYRTSSMLYRFGGISETFDLQMKIKKEVFGGGTVIFNAALSGLDFDRIAITLFSRGKKEEALRLASMILINRLILALEHFCSLEPVDTWTRPFKIPNEMEMIVFRPKSALGVAKKTGLFDKTAAEAIERRRNVGT